MVPAQPPVPAWELLNSPAGIPPPGQISDLNAENPFNIVIIVLISVFMGIASVFVVIRLFTQHSLTKGLVIEDYVIVVAWFFQIAESIVSLCNRRYDGQHLWNLTIQDAENALKAINTVSIMYAVSIGLIKLAILLQYLRLFTSRGTNSPLRIACWTCIVINSLYYTLNMLLLIMQCLPREKIWNPLYTGPSHCLSLFDIWVSTGIFNTISDIVILVLPLPTIVRLQMPTRKRLFVAGIFATGSLACVASAIRTYYTWRALERSDADQTYRIVYVGIWVWIEMFIGILVFCLPTAPQFCLFVARETRGFYTALSTRSASSVEGLSARKESWPSVRNTSSAEGKGGMVPVPPVPSPLPFPEVSLASFEERGLMREEGGIAGVGHGGWEVRAGEGGGYGVGSV